MWFPLLAAAFVNGALREITYGRCMDTAWAHRLSVFTGMAIMSALLWPLLSKWRPVSARESLFGGLLWLVMTEIFEFSMVVLFSGKPFSFFLGMHNLAAGELWPLFLLFIALFPHLFFRIRGPLMSPDNP